MTEVLGRLAASLADRYRIERELGQGGMATVYLAHDVRHERKVALKILRPELAAILGGERFLQEIRTTANLQHPHILPLHDSGEVDGVVFYVMPYVEGESLRDRLSREKQLPVDDAVRIAREVAGALDYAHRHGVVHRDIKPENILLHDGSALVADFGIALAVSTVGGGTRMTETGMSLGTPHYMAPEQAMGDREITPRADIYALGVVLYEMLTGDPPFTGSTAQAIVARVVTESPRSLTAQRHTIARNVEAAVLKALEKLPADRFASAHEFAAALDNAAFAGTAVTSAGLPVLARSSVRRPAVLVPWLFAALAAGTAAWALLRPAPSLPVTRYGLELPPSQQGRPDRPFAISPDGSSLVYMGPAENGSQLWIKRRDRYEAAPLAGTSGVNNFAFSPDGQWLAYTQAGELKKVPLLGGAAITLADSVSANPGLAWADNGSIVYVFIGGSELRRIPDVGGPSTMVWRDTGQANAGSIALFPAPLPGGRGIVFVRCVAVCTLRQDLWSLDLASGATKLVQGGVVMARYLPTGHLLYLRRDGGLFALPFDAGRLEARGAPVPVLDSVQVVNGAIGLMAVSDQGTLVIRPGSPISSRVWYQMVYVNRAGREELVDSSWTFRQVQAGANAGWALSPDGRRLAVGIATETSDDIWVKQLPRGPLSRVTFDSVAEYRPRWTPDGQSVLFGSFDGGSVLRRRADGTGATDTVLDLPQGIFEFAMSPDNRWLIYRTGGTVNQVGNRDIYARRLAPDTATVPLVASPVFDEAAFALSPDGRWLAYESNETGRTEVYVRPFPNAEAGKWQVSTAGGVAPLWARNGRELFFVNAAREMSSAAIAPGPAFHAAAPGTLFPMRSELYLAQGENYTPFDIGPDGRFLMARRVRSEAAQATPLIVAENWFSELRLKVGRR